MLDEEQYSSDSSDDDYLPCGQDTDESIDSEETPRQIDEHDETTDLPSKIKSKKKTARGKLGTQNKATHKGNQPNNLCNRNSSIPPEQALSDNNTEKIDQLWASFKNDDGNTVQHIKSVEPQTPEVKVFEFAGEKVEVVEQKKAEPYSVVALKRPAQLLKSGGLTSVTNKLSNKKLKLSTLEKSRLDWNKFKKDEGIEEDLKSFNQGKHGFLEKQAFLQRADVKQFEIEKHLRAGNKPAK